MKVSETLAIKEFYYNGKKIPIYKGDINLQDKTVTPNSSTQVVTADDGYDGLGTVTVLPQTGGADLDGGLVIISHILPNGIQELVMYGNSDEYGYTADSTEVSGGQNLVLTGEEEEGIDIEALVNARVEAILQELEDGEY